MLPDQRASLAHPSISISIFNQRLPRVQWQPFNLSFQAPKHKAFNHLYLCLFGRNPDLKIPAEPGAEPANHRMVPLFRSTKFLTECASLPNCAAVLCGITSLTQLQAKWKPQNTRQNSSPVRTLFIGLPHHAPPRDRTENLLIKSQLL